MTDYEPDANGKVVFRATPYVDAYSAGWDWTRLYPPDYDLDTIKPLVETLSDIANEVASVPSLPNQEGK